MIENNDNNDFLGFNETDIADVDFFALADEAEGGKTEEETEAEQTLKPGETKPENKDEIQEEENLFDKAEELENTIPEAEKPGETKPEGEDESPTTLEGDSITTLNLLKGKGFIEYELEEGEELTDEKAGEILEDSLDGLFEERIEELFKDVPDIVKEMNKFVLKGGDINVFLQTVATQNTTGLTEGMDLEDEANQELIVRHGLKEEGYDDEYITSQIEFLKDSKQIEKISTKQFKKWEDKNKAEQTAILQSQKTKQDLDKTQRRALKAKVTTFLDETEEVTGFTVTKEDRKVLPNYMSDRTVKLDNGNQITGMQKDLMRVLNSPTGSVQIAKLLKTASEEGELNFEEINKTTETKVVKKVRENVRRSEKSITKSGGKSNMKKALTDYFD